jgi:hypothetical protein
MRIQEVFLELFLEHFGGSRKLSSFNSWFIVQTPKQYWGLQEWLENLMPSVQSFWKVGNLKSLRELLQ